MGLGSVIGSPRPGARELPSARDWLRTHDPGYGALRRAARTALIMPAMFALGDKVIGQPALATFTAFGCFAMLLLVDFSGSIKDRLLNQAVLGVACAILISLATLASRSTWLAAVAMAVVAFGVLFAGVVSSALAGATTTLLLAFILPVSLPGPVSSIPDRVAGWGLAAAVSMLAISLLWPLPARNPVRTAAMDACRALAARLRAEVEFVMSGGEPGARDAHRAAVTRAEEAVQAVQRVFFATPYRPTGLASDARAVIRLVDELRWLNAIVLRGMPAGYAPTPRPRVCAVKREAAAVLEQAADLLQAPGRGGERLGDAVRGLQAAAADLEGAATTTLPDGTGSAGGDAARRGEVVSALDPAFRAQELSFVVAQVAANAQLAAAAARRSWFQRLLGRPVAGLPGPLAAAQERAGSHLERHSVWLHNSLRGAAALGLAVLVADVSGVQHGFWVVFATLSVLRSNALSTGQNVVRALVGTTVGFVIGGVLVYLIGTDTDVLWALLPVVILLAGMAPAVVSFTAGQAAFTLTLLILFNILAPAGWRIGLVRVEDIALGSAVSLAVGLLFWPRGAGAALGRALAQAYLDSTRYLTDAVAYGVACCDAAGPPPAPPGRQAARAAAASRRLDDAYRGYLAERGSKPIPLAEVTGLVNGVAGVRLAADAVLDLWDDAGPGAGDRASARRELLTAAEHIAGWYGRFATSLTGGAAVPDPLAPDPSADGRLVEAVGRDLGDGDGHATATGVRVIWTGDHLDAIRRLQGVLVDPARAAVAQRALSPGAGR